MPQAPRRAAPVAGVEQELQRCRDLVRLGYSWADLPRVYALNLLLLPVILAGVVKSVQQIVLGVKTRWAALGLILYVLGTSIIGHRFWEAAPAAYFGQLMSFMKNLAMVGGLALLATTGPGRYAVDPRP